jgi:thiamine monophosphate kinase
VAALKAAALALGFAFTEIGRVSTGEGVDVRLDGAPVTIVNPGYRH